MSPCVSSRTRGADVPTSVLPTGVESWIDRIGILMFDAASSATLFFSLIVLAMLTCRQPSRRILIARVALLSSLAIIPLVGLQSLPRVDVVKMLLASDLVPRSFFISSTPSQPPLAATTPEYETQRPERHISNLLVTPTPGALRILGRVLIFVELTC